MPCKDLLWALVGLRGFIGFALLKDASLCSLALSLPQSLELQARGTIWLYMPCRPDWAVS